MRALQLLRESYLGLPAYTQMEVRAEQEKAPVSMFTTLAGMVMDARGQWNALLPMLANCEPSAKVTEVRLLHSENAS